MFEEGRNEPVESQETKLLPVTPDTQYGTLVGHVHTCWTPETWGFLLEKGLFLFFVLFFLLTAWSTLFRLIILKEPEAVGRLKETMFPEVDLSLSLWVDKHACLRFPSQLLRHT